jgi:calcium permeable stress-gated cation channel
MTFVCACITWPILFPVNATGGNGNSQLEILSYSNIDIDNSPNRLYAHTFVGWIVYGFIMYMITRECIFYINLRQAFLLNPQYAHRISSRTVLFTCVPPEYLDETRIRQLYSGAVKHVWIAGDTKKLDELIEERDKVAMKLEKGEIKLLKTVNKIRVKAAKKGGDHPEKSAVARDAETGNIAARYITDKQRPHHRLGPLGLIGKKVDTIQWARSELQRLIPEAEAAQADYLAGNYKKAGAVFVEFHNQSDAQAAFQVTTHHHALHMAPRFIGVKPSDVVWKSLSIPWWQLVVRRYAVYGIIAALIIFWAIPVGIVGIIAQVNTLRSLPGLTWIGDIPDVSSFLASQVPGGLSLTRNTGHSRCRFRSVARCCSCHLDVPRASLHARPGQACWCYQSRPG